MCVLSIKVPIRRMSGNLSYAPSIYIYIYIGSYNDWCLYTSIASNKALIRWWLWVHADAVKALSWIFFMYFLLSDREIPRLVKNAEVELVMKPRHPTSIENTWVIQPFLTHCSRRPSYFFPTYAVVSQSKFSSKGTINSIRKTFFI